MLEEIFALDKRLAIANHRLRINFSDYGATHQLVNDYLVSYCNYNALPAHAAVELYNNFTKIYSRHLDIFEENNQYPFQYRDETLIDRLSYDVALILSCVTSSSRYQIIQHLSDYLQKSPAALNICILGAGAGIELALIKKLSARSRITAYDLSFNNFIRHYFSQVQLNEENFITSNVADNFDCIFAIEFLEHLQDYKPFLQKIHQSLKQKGKFICTTATNMPQFDHLYNFTNIESFKAELTQMGFKIIAHQQFSQEQAFRHTQSSNDWFILEKN